MAGTKGWTEESLQKIKDGGRNGGRAGGKHPPSCLCGRCAGLSSASLEKMRQSLCKYYANRPFEKLGKPGRRKRVIEEQDGRCLRCGLKEWQKEVLILELDHIDGDTGNINRDNLRALCPNCHSLTPTYSFTGRHHTEEAKAKIGRRHHAPIV